MIRITWNNLLPPHFTQEDIVTFLIKPAIFNNPILGDKIHSSPFYQKNGKTIEDRLLNTTNRAYRNRLFSIGKESNGPNKDMLQLLVISTADSERIPYSLDSFPIRKEFKKQWLKIISYSSQMRENIITDNDEIIEYERIILTKEELNAYKQYVDSIFENNIDKIKTTWEKMLQISKGKNGKNVTPDFEDVSIILKYKDNDTTLDFNLEDQLLSITSCVQNINLCQKICPNYTLSDEDNLFLERISTLCVIASSPYIWELASANTMDNANENENNKEWYKKQIIRKQIIDLSKMIFPMDSPLLVQLNKKSNSTEFTIDTNKDIESEEKLLEIKTHIDNENYDAAGKLCEEIFLTYNNVKDSLKGTALAHLITCIESGYPRPKYFHSIADIKKEAIELKCSYISKRKSDICEEIQRVNSLNKGVFLTNCDNEINDWIIKTSPENWSHKILKESKFDIKPKLDQKIILINDNLEINIQDSLKILDTVKKSISSGKTIISDWENTELYIRCNEEEIVPLLDTALSFFTEDAKEKHSGSLGLIKIYLIDEAKRCADYLFAQHPSFYPLYFAQNKLKEEKNIHLVIISNNRNTKYAEWLIREGFWTLPRYDQSIKTKITVLSPNSSVICSSISACCPGLTEFSTIDNTPLISSVEIEKEPLNKQLYDISFPEISYKNTSFTNRALQKELREVYSTNDFLYFIVDSSSDLEGINLGIFIREQAIRKAVLDGHSSRYFKHNYTIAIRCFNPDFSGLTQDLIIPKEEEHSNQWFNDYCLITFGSKQDLFSWDQLSGGIIEDVAQCIHLSYSNSDFDFDSCNDNLFSYFRRLYNRESSFAAAISIPYRLFEADIFPEFWSIQNKNAYWNKEIRKKLAQKYFEKLLYIDEIDGTRKVKDETLRVKLAKWEHMRWCCYQLSRGWLPVDVKNVIQFMNNGVTRHVLQIAKLHPCICSWDNLTNLHRELSYECFKKASYENLSLSKNSIEEISPFLNKRFSQYFSFEEDYSYFEKIDFNNIEQTDLILNTSWNTKGKTRDQSSEK